MISKRIFIKGIVQGVGFRPFVYQLAESLKLCGYVLNSGGGVEIEIEGEEKNIEKFLILLKLKKPHQSKIDSIEIFDIKFKNYSNFVIEESKDGEKSTKISPDIAVCKECLSEMKDKNNRRYGYPLINCTNCGPRYTIIKTLPYDRKNTSMSKFKMCIKCKEEYNNPLNRRYHAQPIGCFECGPKLHLYIGDEKIELPQQDIIKKVALLLNSGKIVAVKGLGGFHLVCDATNDEVVKTLRERKRRPSKPFGVMVKNLKMAKSLGTISKKEEELLTSFSRPIVLINSNNNLPISNGVAPDINKIGIMLPYTPIHHLLWDYIFNPLVATSANVSGEPIITKLEDIKSRLSSIIDAVLDYDRDIVNGCDDSVVQVVSDRVIWLRVARGVAPVSINIRDRFTKNVLAIGANQKSTVSIAFENQIVVSPHIGDLETTSSVLYFEKNISILKRFYDFKPEVVVSDKHPNYESSKWAKRNYKNIEILQHHYAHTLSIMAEHNYKDDVLAFVWDGTGFGDDGNIWGGEVLLANRNNYKRVGHLREFKLLGGEKAIKEPKRVALGLLFEIFSLDEVLKLTSHTTEAFRPFEIKALHNSWQKSINSPTTTSIGRFFDGVASLCGVAQTITYEGESGLKLESIYKNQGEISESKFEIVDGVVNWENFIKRVIHPKKEVVVDEFISSLSNIVIDFAKEYKTLPIVLAGGVWQNKTLLEKTLRELQNRDIFLPKVAPMNDGAISIGQAYHSQY